MAKRPRLVVELTRSLEIRRGWRGVAGGGGRAGSGCAGRGVCGNGAHIAAGLISSAAFYLIFPVALNVALPAGVLGF